MLATIAVAAVAAADPSTLGGLLAPAELQTLAQLAPTLHALVRQAEVDPEGLVSEILASPLAVLASDMAPVDEATRLRAKARAAASNSSLPLVVAHGMGDSCFNSGMKSVTQHAGDRLGVNATCIPTGDNKLSDTINGFLMNMDKSVDIFAEKVRADPQLAGGFDAFGLSQGSNLIRGYIAKYNDPPVRTYMAICGINAGVGAFPQCSPGAKVAVVGKVCTALTEVLGDIAYNPIVQKVLFQANYFRDPAKVNRSDYQANSQLAHWNGENPAATDMAARKAAFNRTASFVWVRGTKDTEVWPNEGEQWGAVSDRFPEVIEVLPMNQTHWYRQDSFGLLSQDRAGKNHFESFDGNHIRFTDAELDAWLDKYFK